MKRTTTLNQLFILSLAISLLSCNGEFLNPTFTYTYTSNQKTSSEEVQMTETLEEEHHLTAPVEISEDEISHVFVFCDGPPFWFCATGHTEQSFNAMVALAVEEYVYHNVVEFGIPVHGQILASTDCKDWCENGGPVGIHYLGFIGIKIDPEYEQDLFDLGADWQVYDNPCN